MGDEYILNGRKLFITNGPVADVLLVYAKTDREKNKHGISAFIVKKALGFLSSSKTADGMAGSPTGELVFDDCRVPVGNLVGRKIVEYYYDERLGCGESYRCLLALVLLKEH